MNGNPDSPLRVESLDYREISKPLTFRIIKEDLDALFCADVPEPKKLIMWEHQMDWLVKAERKGEPLEDLSRRPLEEIMYGGRRSGKTAGLFSLIHIPRPAIWGIPVEFHRPLLESVVRDAMDQIREGDLRHHFTWEWNPYRDA